MNNSCKALDIIAQDSSTNCIEKSSSDLLISSAFLEMCVDFSVRFWSNLSELDDLAEKLYIDIFSTKKHRKKQIKLKTIKSMICNLWNAHRHSRCLRVSLQRESYALDKRLGQEFYKYEPIRDVINGLLNQNYIKIKKGFYDRRKNGFSRKSRIWATTRLTDQFKRLEGIAAETAQDPIILLDRQEVVILRNTKKKRIFFHSNEFSISETLKLIAYNNLISITNIDINCGINIQPIFPHNVIDNYKRFLEEIRKSGSSSFRPGYITGYLREELADEWEEDPSLSGILYNLELIQSPAQNHLYRIFNNSDFKQGGRFYGAPYQRIPGQIRKFLTINNEAVVELDFACLHPSMLYNRLGVPAPAKPYRYDRGD
ncbi:MAG: hypothetical protein GYA55_01060, partial [SAR324 cluster bacterium]|nr:hypothetical protein [SAR324 cluster bacterium]